MSKQKISLILTVFNEESSILRFIKSVLNQSILPDELIIIDGGSTDNTLSEISKAKLLKNIKQIKIEVFSKKGNRSIGRNEAVSKASNEIILCSDAGCILDKNWIRNITKSFEDPTVDVVAGYYKGTSRNVFQKCLIPYVLVMQDKIDESNFLPATRSMAFTKNIWKKISGFDEKFSHNEDYIFANKLRSANAKIVFAKDAIVNWIPRKNLKEAFIMFFRFAFGDSESGIIRNKVILLFARYLLFLYFIILFFLIKSMIILLLVIIWCSLYILWTITKNYKYVNHKKAVIILPILQIVSDIAVLTGTSLGFIKSLAKINYKKIIKNNVLFLILLIIYIFTMISVITAGIPNQNHPFNYQMDEWHQFQAVRDVFKYGSPNLPGSANGTMFNFFITGIILVPFYLVRIIDPFAIKSSVDSLLDQEKLFIVLRLTTLFFGILTLILLPKISKLLKINSFLVTLLFIFTPVWLVLSNFFKYDIALTFWITLSIYFFIKYSLTPNIKTFLFACFFSGVAFAVKVSGLPLLPIIILLYFFFTPAFSKKYLHLILGVFLYLLTALFLGLPDIIFGGKNMLFYLYDNITGPSRILENYKLGESLLSLTFLHKFPAIFGHGLYIFSILALFIVSILTINDFKNKKYYEFKIKLFILLSFIIFCLSFIPLGISISANRSVVLLPFIAIIDGIAIKSLNNILKQNYILKAILILIIFIIITMQVFLSYLWLQLKINTPQQVSSAWITKSIQVNSSIGLENIPIYQFEPDFILKDFYNKQYHPDINTKYTYSIIDKNTRKLPTYVILSNVNYEEKYYKNSLKNDLVTRIKLEGYKKIAYFPLSLHFYNYFDKYFYYPSLGLFAYPDGISVYKK